MHKGLHRRFKDQVLVDDEEQLLRLKVQGIEGGQIGLARARRRNHEGLIDVHDAR